MPRRLTNIEARAFLDRHPDIRQEVELVSYNQPGTPDRLSFPQPGLAVKDPSGRYVLVWRDASRRWWYIDLWDVPAFASATNKPPYVTPDQSLFNNILDQLAAAAEAAQSTLKFVAMMSVVAIAVGVGFGAFSHTRARE